MRKIMLAFTGSVALLAATSVSAEPFDGAYGGFTAGYVDLTAAVDLGAGPVRASSDSALFGAVLGYRKDVTNTGFVLGAEAELDYLTNNSDLAYGFSGIAGYQFGDSLLYGRVGFIEYDFDGGSLNGVSFGGGLEYSYNERISIRGEYRYTDLENVGPVSPSSNLYSVSLLWDF